MYYITNTIYSISEHLIVLTTCYLLPVLRSIINITYFVSLLTLVCNTFTPHPGANFALHCGILITFKLALQGSRLSQKRNLPGFSGSLLHTDEGDKNYRVALAPVSFMILVDYLFYI